MSSTQQAEALAFLAKWMLDNNPNKPRLVLPEGAAASADAAALAAQQRQQEEEAAAERWAAALRWRVLGWVGFADQREQLMF